MKFMLLNFRVTAQEMSELKNIANGLGYNLSDYLKQKLFKENEDFNDKEIRYISPCQKKNNLLTVTMLCKMLYLVMELLEKQGYSADEIKQLEGQALNYARNQREKHGYRILNKETE